MQSWEYYVRILAAGSEAESASAVASSLSADLTDLGQDGWELVAVMPRESSVSGKQLVAIFKRPAA